MTSRMHIMQMLIFNASTHTLGAWRNERDQQVGGLSSFEYWKHIARECERGCLDGIFFADTVAVHDQYAGSPDTCIEYGVSWPSQDPFPLVAVMADATRHLGFGITLSTSATPPYLAVRRLSTLDNLTGGRIGWNIVTGVGRAEYRASGIGQLSHDERYDYADEYLAICRALWAGVPKDAILADRATGRFADASRITSVDFQGKYLSCAAAPPTIPSPQGHPVVFQAGSSGRGMRFALENAECVFAIQPHIPGALKFMKQIRSAAETAGREAPKVLLGLQPIIGKTEAEALDRMAVLKAAVPFEANLARLSGLFGIDLSSVDPDAPLDHLNTDASRGLMAATSASVDGRVLSLREVAARWDLSVGIPQIVGTAEHVADTMEEWWHATGCHGFNISPTTNPDSVTDFVDKVVPILQQRGVFRTSYESNTFRETLFEA